MSNGGDWRKKPTREEIIAHHAAHARGRGRGVSWWVAIYPDEPGREAFVIYSMGDGEVWLKDGAGMVSSNAVWSPRDARLMPVEWSTVATETDPS